MPFVIVGIVTAPARNMAHGDKYILMMKTEIKQVRPIARVGTATALVLLTVAEHVITPTYYRRGLLEILILVKEKL